MGLNYGTKRILAASGLAAALTGFCVPAAQGVMASHHASAAHAQLNAVACKGKAECWAVGRRMIDHGKTELNYVLTWRGKTWVRTAVPSPGGVKSGHTNVLTALTCSSKSDCWAVGQFGTSSDFKNQILHWNGKRWLNTAVPQPRVRDETAHGNILNGVTCQAANDCWAVGQYRANVDSILNEVLHWNGTKWTLVDAPNPAGNSGGDDMLVYNNLNGVRCLTASDCWAVGIDEKNLNQPHPNNQALHWDGSNWVSVDLPQAKGGLNGISCITSSDCWAVGTSHQGNEAFQWNGSAWFTEAVPNPSATGNVLRSVRCASAFACWAVGDSGAGAEILKFTTGQWLDGPGQPAQTKLNAVTCTTTSNCWAAGSRHTANGTHARILRWNGTAWVKVNA